jgi:hypothetical protein
MEAILWTASFVSSLYYGAKVGTDGWFAAFLVFDAVWAVALLRRRR